MRLAVALSASLHAAPLAALWFLPEHMSAADRTGTMAIELLWIDETSSSPSHGQGEATTAAARPIMPETRLPAPMPPRPAVAAGGARSSREDVRRQLSSVRSEPTPSVGSGLQEDHAHLDAMSAAGEIQATAATNGEEKHPEAAPLAIEAGTSGGEAVSTWSVLHRVAPVYPAAARRRGSEGRVLLHAVLDDGVPRQVRVVESSGDSQLDAAAREAVWQWRFRASGSMVVEIPIVFRLHDRTQSDEADDGGSAISRHGYP